MNTTADTNALLEQYRALIYKHAHRFKAMFQTVDLEDLAQEGRLGLLHAHARHNPAQEETFINYAGWWVKNRMRRFIIATVDPVRVPETWFTSGRRALRVSMDAPVSSDSTTTLAELLPAPESEPMLSTGVDVRELLATTPLSSLERATLERHYFEGHLQAHIARERGTSHRAVSATIRRALDKLRLNPRLKQAA